MAGAVVRPITPEGFEAKFRVDVDPWNYRASRFEAAKRQVLLRACGGRKVGRGLELACAIGVTSRALARLSLRLLAVDASPTALAEARRLTPASARVAFRRALLPSELPRGPFDLVVVSEIAYYLNRRDLDRLASALCRALAPGGRVVVLHHLRPFDDAAQLPRLAHGRLCRRLEAVALPRFAHRTGRYDARAFVRRRG